MHSKAGNTWLPEERARPGDRESGGTTSCSGKRFQTVVSSDPSLTSFGTRPFERPGAQSLHLGRSGKMGTLAQHQQCSPLREVSEAVELGGAFAASCVGQHESLDFASAQVLAPALRSPPAIHDDETPHHERATAPQTQMSAGCKLAANKVQRDCAPRHRMARRPRASEDARTSCLLSHSPTRAPLVERLSGSHAWRFWHRVGAQSVFCVCAGVSGNRWVATLCRDNMCSELFRTVFTSTAANETRCKCCQECHLSSGGQHSCCSKTAKQHMCPFMCIKLDVTLADALRDGCL